MAIFRSPLLYKTQYKTAALILAAGNSTRMGGDISKQFMQIDGVPVLALTLMAYQKNARISEIIVACRLEDFDEVARIREKYGISKLKQVVAGGKDRRESAERAFSKVSDDIRYVAIADGARCLITPQQITKICLRAYHHKAASAGHLISDTVKRANSMGGIQETVDRTGLWQAQTPQVFHASLYNAALHHAAAESFEATDDNSLVEKLGYRIQMVECGIENLKITTAEDLSLAEAILRYREAQK